MATEARLKIALGSEVGQVDLISPVSLEIADLADQQWAPMLRSAGTADAKWPSWHQIIGDHTGERFGSFALVGPDRAVQGLLVLENGRAMQATSFAEGVTMHYLASAPWNRLNRNGTPLFPSYQRAKPIGTILVTRAFKYSSDLGYNALMNWESLEESLEWYRNQFIGLPGVLNELPRSLSDDGYLTFEVDSEMGNAYLTKNLSLISP